uniref:thiol oxidase n=1 Tax=viral metagenome TaxID=1070528 RepID=A0A6C0CGR7_9ZZZZ
MDPKFWGPGLWKYIHTVAAAADTPEKRDAFHKFIIALAPTLPCKVCKGHFEENQRKFDIRNYKRDQESLLMWTYLMHDAVNQAQGKTKELRPSWVEIRAQYFEVGNDVAAVGPVQTDGTVCQEICSAQSASIVSSTNITKDGKTLKISAKNSRK